MNKIIFLNWAFFASFIFSSEVQVEIKESTGITFVEVPEEFFNRDGVFKSTDYLSKFLSNAYSKGALSDEFRYTDCIELEDVLGAQKGLATLQLFLTSPKPESGCKFITNEYVIKEAKQKEVMELEIRNKSSELNPYVWPNYVEGCPQIILPVSTLSYKFDDKDHFIIIMPKAKGIELANYLKGYRDLLLESASLEELEALINNMKEAYYKVGNSLGNIQKKFLGRDNTSIQHKDFHIRNIFFDKASDKVYWIDTERIGKSAFYLDDLSYLVYITFWDAIVPANIWTVVNKSEWVSMTVEPLIRGYLNAYNPDERLSLLDRIAQNFKTVKYSFIKDYHSYKDFTKELDYIFDLIRSELVNNK